MRYPTALAALVAALAAAAYVAWPALGRTSNRERAEHARQDAQAIAGALIRFYRDNGFFPLWARQADGHLARIDLLVSDGDAPSAPSGSLWIAGRAGTLAGELVTNRPSFALREDPDGMGWSGPYLPESPGADPWGRRYQVNIGLIPSADSPPEDRGPARFAVWVLSSGPDGVIETPYRQPIGNAALAGDDVGVRLQ